MSDWRIARFILIIAAAIAVAYLVSFFSKPPYNFIPKEYDLTIYAIITLISGYIIIRLVSALLLKITEPTLGKTKANGIKNFFEIVAAVVIIGIISAIFTFNITGLLVGAGFAGIVLGLAGQQVLGNIFAGLSLLVSRPFEIGDRITLTTSSYGLLGATYAHENQLNGFTGRVSDIGLFFTKIMLDEGTPSVFPNSVVLGSMVVNHSRVSFRTVRVRMDLDKRLDFNSFKARFLEAMRTYDYIDLQKSGVEIVDVGTLTYQIVMIVWARSVFEEPVKTVMIQEAIKIQKELTSALPSS